MLNSIKKIFTSKKQTFNKGDLVKTIFPKDIFPNSHVGLIVDIVSVDMLKEHEKYEHFLLEFGKKEKIYKVLVNGHFFYWPDYKMKPMKLADIKAL